MVDAPLCAEFWEFAIFQKLGSSIRENYFWYGEQCNEVNYCIYDLLGCGSFAAFHNVWVGTELVNHDEVKLAHVLAEVHVEILEGVGGRFMPTNGLSWIAGFESQVLEKFVMSRFITGHQRDCRALWTILPAA